MKNDKIKLHGFNNLTKSLSFNIYDVCYADTPAQRQAYIEYIDEEYNAERLKQILTEVANIIEANILSVSHQDYDPQGASVTVLIAENETIDGTMDEISSEAPGPLPDTVIGHLDKSHLTVHTYPETHPDKGVSTFRVDIDVSTCGVISPLKALNYLIHSFDSDIVTMDYRIRGFTRDIYGQKHFKDHDITSIQSYLTEETRDRYKTIDVNVYQENIFHTKMMLNDLNLQGYLFNQKLEDISEGKQKEIYEQIENEMLEIFYGKNFN
ncbi:MAG: adenosylmethionine decarboxylase [Gammaproteobacteria bacterium]|nr:MAG: adenosylmethionine decarboxylase [Gammaproteobacteria bacterium]